MNINLFGFKMRLEILILCIIIGGILSTTCFCSCAGGIREGFRIGTNIVGSALDYSIGDGVKSSYIHNEKSQYNKSETNVKGLGVPLPEGKLSLFGENEMNPNCCPSSYSSGKGCVCMTSEQINFLNKRGGNRTLE
tara:strand:+ start:1057 stop:1464 length:408 start_codon:yes stop_codon:yes gene_type:complete